MPVFTAWMVATLGGFLRRSTHRCPFLNECRRQAVMARPAQGLEVVVVVRAPVDSLDDVIDLRGHTEASGELSLALPIVFAAIPSKRL